MMLILGNLEMHLWLPAMYLTDLGATGTSASLKVKCM